MLSEEIRGLVVQARRNVRDPAFLVHVFNLLDEAAAQLEAMEGSAIVVMPPAPDNVVSLARRREQRDG